MKLARVKEAFEAKMTVAGELQNPEISVLNTIAHEALLFVATRCTPVALLRDSVDETESIFRFISGGRVIIDPGVPDFSDTVNDLSLMIDEELNYAVVNKMCALYSRDVKNVMRFENEVKTIINDFKANFLRIGEGI